MEKQQPIRESTVLDKQMYGFEDTVQNVSQNATTIVNNIINANISGTTGYLALFDTANSLTSSSFLYEDTNGVGISTITPQAELHVAAKGLFCAFALDCSPVAGQVLFAADNDGNALWSDLPASGVSGSGTANRVAKFTASDTIGDGDILDNGTTVAIPHNLVSALGRFEVFASGSAHTIYGGYTGTTAGSNAGHFTSSNSQTDTTSAGLFAQHTNAGIALRVNSNTGTGISVLAREAFNMTTDATTTDGASLTGTSMTSGDLLVILSSSTGATGNAVKIDNRGTATSAGALRVLAEGGIAVFGRSKDSESGYFYRNTNTASAPTTTIWQDHTGDANDVLYVRGDGTGLLLRLDDAGANRLTVEDGGVIDTSNSGIVYDTRSISAATDTIAKDDNRILCLTSTATGNITLTLPASISGGEFVFIDWENNGTNNNVILTPDGTDKIDGVNANKTIINANGETVRITGDGTDWVTRVMNRA